MPRKKEAIVENTFAKLSPVLMNKSMSFHQQVPQTPILCAVISWTKIDKPPPRELAFILLYLLFWAAGQQ